MMRLYKKMRRACCLTGCLLAVLFVVRTAHAEEEPSSASWTKRIEAGDFPLLTQDTEELRSLLSRTHERLHAASRYVLQDINHDGAEELLWLYEDEGTGMTFVLAAFAKGADGVRTVFVAEEAAEDSITPLLTDESVYFMNGERMLRLQHNTWLVSEFHCTEVLFDRRFDTYAGEGLTMYLVTDAEAYEAQVDAALKRRLSFLDGRSVRYFQIPVGSRTDEGIAIGADAFMEAFRALTGKSFAQIAPAYETMRTGIERGVSRHVVPASAGDGGRTASYPVTYPQIEEGASAFSPAINTILRQEAFSMEEGEVSYRILHDDDTMISVLFRSVRGEEGGEALKLLTVSKLNGRQIQIGDLTTTDRIVGALEKDRAEVFFLDDAMRRVRDDGMDREAVKAAFEETLGASEDWKSIGMDEQYLYLALRMSGDRQTLLRLPRWEAGVDSPGHMHLLTLHRAYPFLKDVLDDAECLTVRKRSGGFDITYRTMDGGLVTARLTQAEEARREFESPEQARDYYMAQYADVTGFATGSFERQDAEAGERRSGEDGRGIFDTVETAFGEGGRAFVYAGERAYELTQRCQSTRGGLLLRSDGALTDVRGMLRMEINGNGLWNNEQDGTRTEIRRMAEEKTFRFVFLKTEEGQYLMEIRRQGTADVLLRESLATREMPAYRFADVNEDGYDDLEVTLPGETKRYFYDAQTDDFAPAPEVLSRAAGFRYDAGTGYLVVTEQRTEGREERALYLPEDTEQAARTYEAEAVSGGIRYRVSDLTTGEETVLLELTVADDAAEDGEGARIADELFRTRIVWQEVTDAPAGTATAGEESKKVRIIAGQFFRQDLFAPYYENRLYLLEEGGGLLYTYDIPVQERLLRVTRGYVNGEEALSLYFETEAPVTIATGSLYESF